MLCHEPALGLVERHSNAMTIRNRVVTARKMRPATRTNFFHVKNDKPYCFAPNPRGGKIQNKQAGLLTDSRLRAFPTSSQWQRVRKPNGVSQQRDCPGFSPDSLFTPCLRMETGRTHSGAKINDFKNSDYLCPCIGCCRATLARQIRESGEKPEQYPLL